MRKNISIRIIIIAAVVVCLLIWGAWKNTPQEAPARLDAAAVAAELLGVDVKPGNLNATLAKQHTQSTPDYRETLQQLAPDILLMEYYNCIGGTATQEALQGCRELMMCRLASAGVPTELCTQFAAVWKAQQTAAEAQKQGNAIPMETMQQLWDTPGITVLLYRNGVDIDAALKALPQDATAATDPPLTLYRLAAKLKKELTR